MFCSRVLAETLESVESIGRFVRNSFAHFVCANIADELKFVQANSYEKKMLKQRPLKFAKTLKQKKESKFPKKLKQRF